MSAEWVSVIVAIIAAAGSIAGVVVTNNRSNRDIDAKIEKTQAVFEAHVTEQIKQLSERVEKHNTVIERTYALEKKVELQGAEVERHKERIKILEGK